MSDLIDRQKLLEALDKFIPFDPMKDDYTKGITVGVALATGCVETFSQENGGFSQGLVKDLISRKDAIDAIMSEPPDAHYPSWYADILWKLPSAEPRKKGKWIYGEKSGQDGWYCSECNGFVPWYYDFYGLDNIDFIEDFKTCPFCDSKMVSYTGADMREGEEE